MGTILEYVEFIMSKEQSICPRRKTQTQELVDPHSQMQERHINASMRVHTAVPIGIPQEPRHRVTSKTRQEGGRGKADVGGGTPVQGTARSPAE